jgi:hypothetical protein
MLQTLTILHAGEGAVLGRGLCEGRKAKQEAAAKRNHRI